MRWTLTGNTLALDQRLICNFRVVTSTVSCLICLRVDPTECCFTPSAVLYGNLGNLAYQLGSIQRSLFLVQPYIFKTRVAALVILLGSLVGWSLRGSTIAVAPVQWRSQSIYFMLTGRFVRTDGPTTKPCDTSK